MEVVPADVVLHYEIWGCYLQLVQVSKPENDVFT